MEKAINSILIGGEDVEILNRQRWFKRRNAGNRRTVRSSISDDRQGDPKRKRRTRRCVNCGLSHATGKYFKVVDSDDWVDESSLFKILETVKTFVKEDTLVDMVISNYVYEKVGMEHKKVIRYDNVLPENTIFHWDEIGHFRLDQYILMHSVLYRTEMLKLCQLKLPKHTFYVDNIYVYYPLPHVRTLYYLNVDFYRYFIGREDQSVNEKIMIGRIDQQLFVTKTMISMYELRMISSKKLRKYMVNYLAIMMTVSSILCIRSKKPENLTKKKDCELLKTKRLQNLYEDPLRYTQDRR